jgi:hypothetical protein
MGGQVERSRSFSLQRQGGPSGPVPAVGERDGSCRESVVWSGDGSEDALSLYAVSTGRALKGNEAQESNGPLVSAMESEGNGLDVGAKP